jgi:hypothetical protein
MEKEGIRGFVASKRTSEMWNLWLTTRFNQRRMEKQTKGEWIEKGTERERATIPLLLP